jgi:hypothetical protein
MTCKCSLVLVVGAFLATANGKTLHHFVLFRLNSDEKRLSEGHTKLTTVLNEVVRGFPLSLKDIALKYVEPSQLIIHHHSTLRTQSS